MAEARKRVGRRAAIAGFLVLAALLYAAPVAAADSVVATSSDSSTPTVIISQQGVEWTDVVRNPTGTPRRSPGRTVLGIEWTASPAQPLGVEWTD